MINRLFKVWYPEYLQKNQEHEPYLKFIIGLGYIGIFVEIAYLILNLIQGIPIFPTNSPILGFFLMLIVVKFSKSYVFAAHFFLSVFCATIVGLVIYYQQFPYTIFLWIPVFAIISVYLLGKNIGILWSIILGLCNIIAIYSFSNTNIKYGYSIQINQVKPVLIISIVLTLTAALYASILFINYINSLNRQLDSKNKQLTLQKQALQENMEEKKAIISIICHDIANPLTVVSAAANMALSKKSDFEKYLEKIQRSANLISDIINEVKAIQAVESGKFQLELKPTDLIHVFETIKFIFDDRLNSKNLELIFEYDENTNLCVEADETSLIHNVLSNLISNAIKFSDPYSKIVVQAKEKQGKVYLSIKDFGIGMPENIVRDLFKQDKRTTRLGTVGEKGTGFGMPIAKIYMEKYGGQVDVQSKEKAKEYANEEHGTTFTLTFKSADKKRA